MTEKSKGWTRYAFGTRHHTHTPTHPPTHKHRDTDTYTHSHIYIYIYIYIYTLHDGKVHRLAKIYSWNETKKYFLTYIRWWST